ncbi:TPA: nucleotidyltransferase domain-containing protein [Candidatus Woesearchaeota archaeon]|nr:nucleotidyltransferase domain-containing protein [Candidatus Woesearchaeota archaeon]HIH54433.1 nucleotidyltransferase domain-containing protein [Candidatus Woesearchaeota archaeon]HIJ02283.1 nucleotidyltransferase domain-containing protein [Candidatus Woesearchaeota archaeon]HIJ14227.1 nucleotidyltransferase domain-containing protein [Candidatus Woesearchaeota archaeon]
MSKKKVNDSYINAPSIDSAFPADMPEEAKKKLNEIKGKLDKFQKKVMDKFSDYILGMALMPPPKPEKDEEGNEKPVDKNKIFILVLVDDSDSKKMSKEELKEKLGTIINSMAQEVDKNISPETVILTELWQSCYDGKYDILEVIALSLPLFDKGMLAAIKIAEVHKTMVLKKFEKYIVSYVLVGSLVQGRATNKSDIDVFITIDDTDVKKMTRAELKDKLRAIIIGMGIDAGKMTGIENKINIQVYILTDFWENIKEANPVIFTFLRDGVPFYDRGIFMPWKQLLQMGRVKPSPEAIDMFMHSGEQILERVNFKLVEIATEDFFWATLTPTQAAIMLYGLPPPTPKETPEVMSDIFVSKEKMLEQEYVEILRKVLKTRKDIEHGDKKIVSGKEIDSLIEDSKKYLKRMNDLFKQIEELKEAESVKHNYETVVTVVRDILKLEGIEKISDTDILKSFEQEVIHKGLIPEKYLGMLKDIVKTKKDYDINKLSKTEVHESNKDAREFIKFLVEYIQRKRGRELDRVKIRVKHGNKFGEVIILDKKAFIVHDIDNEEKEISKADVSPEGRLININESSLEELEHALARIDIPQKTFIKETLFENLKSIFGKDVEILINY